MVFPVLIKFHFSGEYCFLSINSFAKWVIICSFLQVYRLILEVVLCKTIPDCMLLEKAHVGKMNEYWTVVNTSLQVFLGMFFFWL